MKKSKNIIRNSDDLLKVIKEGEKIPVEKVIFSDKNVTRECTCQFCKDSKIWRALMDRQANDEDKKIINDLVCKLIDVEDNLEWLEWKYEKN